MPTEIIRELIKSDENIVIPIECVVIWATKIQAQRGQAAVMSSLNEMNNFDAI